ncbi:MAG: hypothetical protein H6619_00055 [Deltaproteobacteria bacterium]|nr:hypothetical protein [Deltaproteobacteria bacterium]
MRSERINREFGYSLVELIVSLMLFSVLIFGMTTYSDTTLRDLGLENRTADAVREVRNTVSVMSSELRMGSNISPYLPGNDPSLVSCSSQLTASSTTIRFLVVHDDVSATSGIQPYYVGYMYDAATRRLLRGEVQGLSTTSCTLPSDDPLSGSNARVIAEKVVQVGAQPVFSLNGSILTVTFGVEVDGGAGLSKTQNFSTRVFVRGI